MLDHRLGNYVFLLTLRVDPGKSYSFAAKEYNFGFIRSQNGLPKRVWLVQVLPCKYQSPSSIDFGDVGLFLLYICPQSR